MNKQKLLREEELRYKEYTDTINRIPDEIDELDVIESVLKNYLYLVTVDTFKEHLDLLHIFAKHFGTYKIDGYSAFSGGLSMVYKFSDFGMSVYMYCREIEVALESVGQGKCKVVEEWSTPYKRKSVVCDGI